MSGPFPEFCAALTANAYSAVVYADRTGKIRFWNNGAERIFGYRAAEAIGQPVDMIIPETLRDRHWKGFYGRIGTTWGGPRKWSTLPCRHKDGATIPLESTLLVIQDDHGLVTGIAGFFCQAET